MSPIAKALHRMYERQAEHALAMLMLMLCIAIKLECGIKPGEVRA